MIRKKLFMMIVFIISCSIYAIAQTDYYYYKGKKISLTLNENKVCVSIPKDYKEIYERIRANVQVLKAIGDKTFNIIVISRLDFEKLTSLDSWAEDSRNVILTSCFFTEKNEEVCSTPYLNVELKKKEDIDVLTLYAEKYGLRIIGNSSLMPLWYILSITQGGDKNSLECANVLFESGKFAESVADFCSDDLECSNDPYFYQQWGLQNSYNIDIDISACAAWNYATGKNIKIAILDTGIDMNHIDLASNISDLSYDTETESSPSVIYHEHGTECAGIAAAIKDNGIQIAGVAPEATLISISNSLDTTTNSRLNRAKGIVWAYQHGADIISNSWSSKTYHAAIDIAIKDAFIFGRNGKGCVIVFAAGNKKENDITHDVKYPANCNDTILVVGSINKIGDRVSNSNYGTKLDLVAPGDSILTTSPNNFLRYDDGTSMACPHVAGVAALILERNSELTVSQVNSIICSSAKKLSGVNFNVIKPDGSWNNQFGYGLVDAYNAVTNTPSTVYIQNETITGTRILSAENIYVGRDVTNTKPYGDVVLGQGNITIKADYIEIKNSTTVPLGTTLTIENQ